MGVMDRLVSVRLPAELAAALASRGRLSDQIRLACEAWVSPTAVSVAPVVAAVPAVRRASSSAVPAMDVCASCGHARASHRPVKGSSRTHCTFGTCSCRAGLTDKG